MSRTFNCTEEVISVSKGKEDIGKLALLANDGKFDPSVIPMIIELQDQITKEETVRSDADKKLQVNIDAEVSTRTVADQQLQANIKAESEIRSSTDKSLQEQVDVLKDKNAFSNVVVNGTIIHANSQTDTLELVAGTNIALTADTINEKVTIAVTGKVVSAAQADSATAAAKLETAHTINDVAFDGSMNINITQMNGKDIATIDQIPNKASQIGAETPEGAQAKADAAKTEANSYTDTKVAGLVNDAPSTLDTLKELADALNNDSNFAATVINQLAQKADKSQIPTSLPANGGNADTLNGKSANDIICACSYYGIPAGAVQYFATPAAPKGWLKADGAAVSRTQYADLFTAIGTLYGTGDGSTTFNLPDLRGEFVRGFDDGRGVDSSRTLGSSQTDEFKSHNHFCATYNGLSGTYETAYTTGGYDYGAQAPPTTSVGGSETRPRNVALLACIKY